MARVYFNYAYMEIILIISVVLAVVGGLVIYFTFMSKKNEWRFKKGFSGWLYKFLHFRELVLKHILKVLYVIIAVFLTVFGIFSIFSYGGGMIFLFTAVLGNIIVRIAYEFLMMLILLVDNTTAIRKKLTGSDEEDADIFDPLESEIETDESDFED